MSNAGGVLYLVATPIGNLEDITARAVRLLGEVDLILAEDTRHTRQLLTHLGIATPLVALHEHNERQQAQQLADRLDAGARMALVSDAGTPLVSDPGFPLVRECLRHDIRVAPVPGASALLAALTASGLPTDRFRFEGFLPRTAGARRARLAALARDTVTLVFYESPHRLQATLEDMVDAFGESRPAVLARELTKRYETLLHATLRELCVRVAADPDQRRGESVLVVAGTPEGRSSLAVCDAERVLDLLLEELPVKRAAALAARLTGEKKNTLYQLALRRRGAHDSE